MHINGIPGKKGGEKEVDFDVNRMTLSGKNCHKRGEKQLIDMEDVYRFLDKENMSVAELCEMFHCSRTTLQRYHRRYQADNPKTKRRYLTGNSINRCSQYKYINMERILEEIDNGKTITQICRENNISRTTLRRKFIEYRTEKIEELREQTEAKREEEENGET